MKRRCENRLAVPHSSLTPVFFIFASKMSAISSRRAGALGEGRGLRPDVGVVEAEIGNAEQREHLEGDVGLELRLLHRVAEPGALESLAAERIAARPGEGMPIGDGEAQMVLHPLAGDDLVLVVEAIGERIGRIRPFIFDLA